MREEVRATVTLIYDAPAEAAIGAQSQMIHDDLCRLLDADSTTGVEATGFTITRVYSEAETYGNR